MHFEFLAASCGREQRQALPCRDLNWTVCFNADFSPCAAMRLGPLSAILIAMAANPSNPVFNHNLFEEWTEPLMCPRVFGSLIT